MTTSIAPATTRQEIQSCRELVAQVYGEAYGVQFSEGQFDLQRNVEGWPDRFLMARDGVDLAGCLGLYESETYVERFGGVSAEDLERHLTEAGVPIVARRPCVELTRLTTRKELRSRRTAWLLAGAGHSIAFLGTVCGKPPLVLTSMRLSLSEGLIAPLSIRYRTLKPFPLYPIHDRYRVAGDPMVCRLSIPEIDVPSRWLNLQLPAELSSAALRKPAREERASVSAVPAAPWSPPRLSPA